MPLSVPSGPYAISTLTIETAVRDAQSFAPDKFSLGGKAVLQLRTVLVTLFYPTYLINQNGTGAQSKRPSAPGGGISWLPSPKMRSLEGLVKYAGVSKYFAYPAVFVLPSMTRLPYTNDGPLASTSPHIVPPHSEPAQALPALASATPASDRFPVGIFSHGLAGCRTTYSQYLAELASQGMVIASVEHRDGSAPSTTIQFNDERKDETITYFKHDELDKGQDGQEKASIWDFRKAQLDLRQAEVLEAAHLLQQLNDGQGGDLAATTRDISAKAELQSWKDRLDLKNLWAIGHSFGGATCIELIRKKESVFTHALVLDPWLEAIAKVGEPAAQPLQRPLFVINSDAFTIWRSHFAQLKQLVRESYQRTGRGWLMTLTKTAHTDFSDFPLLMPRFFKNKSGVPPQALVSLFSQASQMEFVGQFDKEKLAFPVRDEIEGEVERRDLGKGGQVIWHAVDDEGNAHSSASASRL